MAKKKDGPTKAEAVRAALAAGVDAPQEGAAFVKEKFGLDISAQQFSTYKSIEKKKGNGGSAPARRSQRLKVPTRASADPVELARQVKHLIHNYGASAVSDMLAVLTD